jgi:hypothetical protein
VALAAIAFYVGAYYATVIPYGRHAQGMGPWYSYGIGGTRLSDEAYVLFGPAHWLDRKARPGTWWMREGFLPPELPTFRATRPNPPLE